MYSYVYNNYVTLFLCPSLWYVFGEHCVAVRCTIRTLRVLPVARTVIVCGTKKKSRSETKIEKFQRTHTGSVERSASDAVTEAAMIMYNSHRSYVTFESPSERGLESIFSLSHSIFFLLSRNVIQFETILWQSTRTTVRGRFDINETKCRASYKRDQIENWYLKGNKIRFVSVWVLVLFIFFFLFSVFGAFRSILVVELLPSMDRRLRWLRWRWQQQQRQPHWKQKKITKTSFQWLHVNPNSRTQRCALFLAWADCALPHTSVTSTFDASFSFQSKRTHSQLTATDAAACSVLCRQSIWLILTFIYSIALIMWATFSFVLNFKLKEEQREKMRKKNTLQHSRFLFAADSQ